MPAKNNDKAKRKKRPSKPSGKTAKQIKEQADKTGRKKAMCLLPVPIPKTPEEEPVSEAELTYREKMIAVEIERLAARGLTNDEIIASLDVARSTFYDWIREKPYFSYVLMKHRELAGIEVENALFKNAVGFDYLEQTATASGKVVTILKQKLPETKAQQFYLTNRRPEQWKNKVETVHALGQGMQAITFSIKRYEE